MTDVSGIGPEVLDRLGDALGDGRLTVLDARPVATASTHPLYRLTVTREDGRCDTLVAKHAQKRPGRTLDREELVYRRVLAGRRFGAPLLHASLSVGPAGDSWLFLEDVGGQRLDWCGEPAWVATFRALAHLHAPYYAREQDLAALGCLIEHDADFYGGLATAAGASLARHGTAAELARLESLRNRWLGGTVSELTAQPSTLVHGCMYAQNVHVQPGLRVRLVDWETAAIGVPAWDLTRLFAGWGSMKPQLLGEYTSELTRQGQEIDRRALARSVLHCDVLRSLRLLYWWKEPCREPGYVDRLLDQMERIWRRLAGQRHG